MRLRLVTLLICSLPIACALHAQSSRGAGVVNRLGWFAGCWQQVDRARGTVIDEQWMAPRGGVMFGMSRTVRGDSTVVEFEHLQVLQRNGHAVYHAEPSGQPPAEFVAATVSDTIVVFENSTHDFPQRIIYRRRGRDSLLARIEGRMNGRARSVDFGYARAGCGA